MNPLLKIDFIVALICSRLLLYEKNVDCDASTEYQHHNHNDQHDHEYRGFACFRASKAGIVFGTCCGRRRCQPRSWCCRNPISICICYSWTRRRRRWRRTRDWRGRSLKSGCSSARRGRCCLSRSTVCCCYGVTWRWTRSSTCLSCRTRLSSSSTWLSCRTRLSGGTWLSCGTRRSSTWLSCCTWLSSCIWRRWATSTCNQKKRAGWRLLRQDPPTVVETLIKPNPPRSERIA